MTPGRRVDADALDCEDQGRMSGRDRPGQVVFPNGSIAVLPADDQLQLAVVKESIRLHTCGNPLAFVDEQTGPEDVTTYTVCFDCNVEVRDQPEAW